MALSSILAKHLPSCGKSTKSKHFTFNFFLNFVKFSCLPTLTQSEGGEASSTELNGSSFKGCWQRMVTFSTIPLISAEQLGCDHHKSGAKLGEGDHRDLRRGRQLSELQQRGAMGDTEPPARRRWVGRGSTGSREENPSLQGGEHPSVVWSTWEVSEGLGEAALSLAASAQPLQSPQGFVFMGTGSTTKGLQKILLIWL